MMKRMKPLANVCAALLFLVACSGNKDQNVNTENNAAPKQVPGTKVKLDSTKRYIFLTWDDSPQPPGTMVCKEIFEKQQVKATFFAVGMHAFDIRRRQLVKDLEKCYPQFLVANHSFTHGFNNKYKDFYKQPDSAVADFLRAETALNIPVKIIRLPGNNSWVLDGDSKGPKSTEKVYRKLDTLGYSVIGWDVEWTFIKGNIPKVGAEEMVKEINQKFEDGLTVAPNAIVILAHDRMFAKPQYADSLTRFITLLKADPRYEFETIDHYPLVKYPSNREMLDKAKAK